MSGKYIGDYPMSKEFSVAHFTFLKWCGSVPLAFSSAICIVLWSCLIKSR